MIMRPDDVFKHRALLNSIAPFLRVMSTTSIESFCLQSVQDPNPIYLIDLLKHHTTQEAEPSITESLSPILLYLCGHNFFPTIVKLKPKKKSYIIGVLSFTSPTMFTFTSHSIYINLYHPFRINHLLLEQPNKQRNFQLKLLEISPVWLVLVLLQSDNM